MKFTNGNWLVKEGFMIHHPHQVHDVLKEEDALTLFVPCKAIRHRGDTLDGPLLTIRISSPMENVFRIQTWHFKGGKEKYPQFKLNQKASAIEIYQNNHKWELYSGQTKLKIPTDDIFRMEFFNQDKKLTHSDQKGLAWIRGNDNKTYMRGQLNINVGEYFYGLGERFTPFVKNGQVVDSWNKDGGTSTEQAYKNVPFYLSNRGYGVFVNHPEHVAFEMGSEIVSKNQFSVEGEELDYFFINGPTPKEVLERYTDLTGKPAVPPAWSFGLWLTTSFTTEYNEETVNHFVDGMLERKLPLSVFHFDCFWMKDMEWCNFEWDERNFPDPKGMIKRLKDKGLKICVWINPYIAQKSKLFAEAASKGYLLKRPDGDVWQWDLWQAGQGVVDFSNPDACEWYADKLRALIDMGVDSFKTDFGERIPTDVVYWDGSDPERMHNYYSYKYNQVVFDVLQEKKGGEEAVVFARSSTAGGQQFPVHWGGDCYATYESMAESLRGGLSLCLSGFGYWSHDIGGFENTASPDLFKRWLAFGLLSSHSRLHGSSSYRVPWLFDEEAVDVTRFFAQLKNTLMPYLMNVAKDNNKTGIPLMRAMVLEFPEDPTCAMLDLQYMLGDSLLVAPIFNEEGEASYYLPNGKWTNLLTGAVVEGGTWQQEYHDYMSIPLFVREHTILPIGQNKERPDYHYSEEVTFYVYELQERKKASAVIRNVTGDIVGSISMEKDGEQIVVEADMPSSYSINLSGYSTIAKTTSGHWSTGKQGVQIIPKSSDSQYAIHL
ncbi:alpha-xylosidase [Radiobacillus deserti]|uniref:alpha-D-xyloside xylohydrolase n=1 Tax=Radiobacillus deserti TaxID=2594883 RepID=A0A516KI80_9BACI|nr:alpha-xylosidase [Radiobacillus deserti]QDP41107.1 alpha-xylosidase [Radiobacillus deserti]